MMTKRNKVIIICCTLFFSITLSSQSNRINFLFESGINNVNSHSKLNFGTGIEYILSSKHSLTLKVKYFQTGIDYHIKSFGCNSFASFFCFPSKRFLYKGKVLKIPFSYKLTNKLFFKNLSYFLSVGAALSITIEEEFIKMINLTPLNNKTSLNLSTSIGVIYKINDNLDVYLTPELFLFGNDKSKEKVDRLLFSGKLAPDSSLFSVGISYKL